MAVERPKELTLDVSGIFDEETLHEYLSKKLDFPGYYGMNWDAFYDCVMYDPEMRMPQVLKVQGFAALEAALPAAAKKFAACLADYTDENPTHQVVYEDVQKA